ncbi:hypothetical protein AURDEDRAFT_116247 [Auricularia subglabra TFB-10046 SS5]|nr:hypothetical protein AURDEDRAFT_116247 [Auricularia subglabra TFB-10046 SS5]
MELAPEQLNSYSCVRFGECEACPQQALHQPYCQPYGNRRLLHCVQLHNSSLPSSSHDWVHQHEHDEHDGHIPAWESCGRTPGREREDYWQFVMCNIFFAMIALVLLFARSRVVAAMQARRLAARIGVRWTAGVGAR